MNRACLKLPCHYFPVLANQLEVLLTESSTAYQNSTECYISIIGGFLYTKLYSVVSMLTCPIRHALLPKYESHMTFHLQIKTLRRDTNQHHFHCVSAS